MRGLPDAAYRRWKSLGVSPTISAERRAERPQAGVADRVAHLGDREVGGPQQVLGARDPALGEVGGGRGPVRRPEGPHEVGAAHPGQARHQVEVELLGVVAVEVVPGPPQVDQDVAGDAPPRSHRRDRPQPDPRQRGDRRAEDLGVAVDVGVGVVRAEQRHVVEGRQQHAPVEAPQVQEALQVLVDGGGRGGAVARWRAEPVLRPAAQPLHVPRQPVPVDHPGHARREPLGERDGRGEVLLAQAGRERRAHGRERQRVAGEGAADAGDVDLVPLHRPRQPVGDLRRHAVRRHRDAAADRLADDQQVGLETPGRGGPARAGAQRVGLVDHQQHAVAARDLPHRVEVAGLGEHDPDVGERRLHQQAGHVALRQPPVQGVRVVEGDDRRGLGHGHLRPQRARPWHDPVTVQHGQGLVDRAVVAPVHHRDPGPPGQVAREPQHEPVGVGGRHRQLPGGQPEPAYQLVGDPRGVRGGQHRGDAARGLRGQRLGDLRERVAGHRAGVAQAEVDVVVPVHVGQPGTGRRLDEHREPARPPGHPRHRHAGEQRALRVGRERGRARVVLDEASFLVAAQRRQPVTVDHRSKVSLPRAHG